MVPGPLTPLLGICSRDKCPWVPPNGSNDGMAWDGTMFPSLVCKGSPYWQPFWFSQLLLHASFYLSSRNLFQNSADLFCFRIYWFCLLGYCPSAEWLNAAYHLPGAVDAPAGGRADVRCLPLPIPAGLWTLLFYDDDDVSVENYHLSWTAEEWGSLLQWRNIIIIGNRFSNCVCNHFLLKTLVHLRRETSCFLGKEECHDDLSLVNHPKLNFPVFSIALALFSLEKQPESTSDFFGNFEGQFC